MKEKLYLKREEEYSPRNPKSDPLTGNVKLWYGYDERCVAVVWAATKKAATEEARRSGYTITTKNPFRA